METRKFRPARFVAFVDTLAFSPENVRVTWVETGSLQYGFQAYDGTWFNIYDNRPEVRSAFACVRETSDACDLTELALDSCHCKGNVEANKTAQKAYRQAVSAWKGTLGSKAFVQIRERKSGYLYGSFDTPKEGSQPAWATFFVEVGGYPTGVTMWETFVDNIALYFLPLEKGNKATTDLPAVEGIGRRVATAEPNDNGNGHKDEIEPLKVGEQAVQLSADELKGADLGLLPESLLPAAA